MIHYEEHAAVGNGCSIDREFVLDPVDVGAVGRHGDPDHCQSGHDNSDYARSLSALIESEIIPRLMVAHATVTPAPTEIENDAMIDAGEIEVFASLVMHVEADALLLHVESILARGAAIDAVLVDLLAPTARLLGEIWEDERCDFVDVTMGFWRLQEVVHELSRRLPAKRRSLAEDRRAQRAPLPGDQHSSAKVVVDEIFRQDGWLANRLSAAKSRRSAEARGGRLVRHNGIDRKF